MLINYYKEKEISRKVETPDPHLTEEQKKPGGLPKK
jgi:hypothetical protein